jgi:hypothetical protein
MWFLPKTSRLLQARRAHAGPSILLVWLLAAAAAAPAFAQAPDEHAKLTFGDYHFPSA